MQRWEVLKLAVTRHANKKVPRTQPNQQKTNQNKPKQTRRNQEKLNPRQLDPDTILRNQTQTKPALTQPNQPS